MPRITTSDLSALSCRSLYRNHSRTAVEQLASFTHFENFVHDFHFSVASFAYNSVHYVAHSVVSFILLSAAYSGILSHFRTLTSHNAESTPTASRSLLFTRRTDSVQSQLTTVERQSASVPVHEPQRSAAFSDRLQLLTVQCTEARFIYGVLIKTVLVHRNKLTCTGSHQAMCTVQQLNNHATYW